MKNKGVAKRLAEYLKPNLFFIVLSFILAIVSVILTLYIPILTGNAVDLIIAKGRVDFAKITPILFTMGVCIAVCALAQWLMGLCNYRVAYKTVRDIRVKAMQKIQVLPLSYLDTQSHGEIMSRMITDVEQISDGLILGFSQFFSGLITIIGTIGFMLSINIKITLIVVLVTPLSFFVAAFIARRTFSMFKKQSEIRAQMTSLTEEMVGSQKLVKAFGYESRAQGRFDKINQDLKVCGIRALFFSSLTNPCTRFVNSVVYTGVGIFGAMSVIGGAISVGQLSCFLSYANQYTKPFNEISGVVTELQSALASASRVFDLIDQPAELPDAKNAKVLKDVNGSVKLKNVAFSYTADKEFITDLNIDAKPGQTIALVGPTGCGKTTIINLLMRFYDVDHGQIFISGNEAYSVTRDSLRSAFGMVLQDTWLKTATVHENIAYGNPNASREQVINAAKLAHAHSFIKRLPNGYDTVISDDKSNISQGQKQLLCIARVMLTHPPMLILDEATSSIDTRTEIRIQKAFLELMKDRTSFIVAHRLSTIQNADMILVMKDGHIIERGTHMSLLEKGGFYSELYNSQFSVK